MYSAGTLEFVAVSEFNRKRRIKTVVNKFSVLIYRPVCSFDYGQILYNKAFNRAGFNRHVKGRLNTRSGKLGPYLIGVANRPIAAGLHGPDRQAVPFAVYCNAIFPCTYRKYSSVPHFDPEAGSKVGITICPVLIDIAAGVFGNRNIINFKTFNRPRNNRRAECCRRSECFCKSAHRCSRKQLGLNLVGVPYRPVTLFFILNGFERKRQHISVGQFELTLIAA